MERVMLVFPRLGYFDANGATPMDIYVRKLLMQDEEWPSNYDIWNPEGRDWGWLAQSRPGTTPNQLRAVMAKHKFKFTLTYWGAPRYVFMPTHEIPKILAAIEPPNSNCIICTDPLPQELTSTILPCTHTFHRGCILLWLAQNGRCPVCRQNTKDVIDELYDLKARGNDAAKERHWLEALNFYSKCLSQLDLLGDIPGLRIALYLNMALMYLRLKSWNDAESSALQALKVGCITGQQAAKARYRLALANMGLENWESAQINLIEAKLHAPDDADISKALKDAQILAQSTS